MSSFADRFGSLTAGQVLELNETAIRLAHGWEGTERKENEEY